MRGIHPLEAYVVVLSNFERPGAVVLAASPKVKKEFGIKTGSRKYEIPNDPKLMVVKPRMELYLRVNRQLIGILKGFVADEDLLIYSIDEMCLDVTAYENIFGDVETIAKRIQATIWERLRLVTTLGIGPNPLMAKVCMDVEAKKKRSAMARWRYEDVPDKIWGIQEMTDFWGIGSRTQKKLRTMGIWSLHDLAHADVGFLKKHMGVMGEEIYYHAHGVDYTILSERNQVEGPKESGGRSVGNGQTLFKDYTSRFEIEAIIREMADKVGARLRKMDRVAGTVKLSMGFSKSCEEKGFGHQVKVEPTNSTPKLIEACLALFYIHWDGQPVRHVGITASKLRETEHCQFSLFEPAEEKLKRERLEKTMDAVRARYGFPALIYGHSLREGATAVKRSGLIAGHKA